MKKKKKYEMSMNEIVIATIIVVILGKYLGWW